MLIQHFQDWENIKIIGFYYFIIIIYYYCNGKYDKRTLADYNRLASRENCLASHEN